ncbi:TrbI/VirB10 family protein [Duganella vulcania]|uniref:Conjugal transfer protein TraB n=1 Tax=Duganella vulcania TaxID=2692166 RepID=A0A845GRB0_9BURK|nr:TrbI/VirB10 family protein [Duganella vulcania]MYM95922.1 conjugal transfer protein TraB [Duganella vulcania]
MSALSRLRLAYDTMPHRRRQYLNLGAVLVAGSGALWFVFSLGQTQPVAERASKAGKSAPINLGIQVPGEIDPREAWLGTAGREVAQLKADVESQQRKETERRATEDALMRRLAELEQRGAAGAAQPAPQPALISTPPQPTGPVVAASSQSGGYPPASPMAMPSASAAAAGEDMRGPGAGAEAPIVRISLAPGNGKPAPRAAPPEPPAAIPRDDKEAAATSYLPVSFTSGLLLGGIDAPTGGQAQSNPLPILVRLTDNAVLPNRYRAEVKDCFVVAAGWGDISSERVYARTATLSCVRHDGTTLEMPIQGNLYGEDGKLGLRGRLVTKQGQLLANALRAGIVSGIGQGFAQGGTTFTNSPFGTLATSSGGTGEQVRRGVAGGVGRALDNLANYYIRLAEQTFPVVEVDAGRMVEVAITKGSSMPVAGGRVDTPDKDEGYHDED